MHITAFLIGMGGVGMAFYGAQLIFAVGSVFSVITGIVVFFAGLMWSRVAIDMLHDNKITDYEK